jgi:hypothetical protein
LAEARDLEGVETWAQEANRPNKINDMTIFKTFIGPPHCVPRIFYLKLAMRRSEGNLPSKQIIFFQGSQQLVPFCPLGIERGLYRILRIFQIHISHIVHFCAFHIAQQTCGMNPYDRKK